MLSKLAKPEPQKPSTSKGVKKQGQIPAKKTKTTTPVAPKPPPENPGWQPLTDEAKLDADLKFVGSMLDNVEMDTSPNVRDVLLRVSHSMVQDKIVAAYKCARRNGRKTILVSDFEQSRLDSIGEYVRRAHSERVRLRKETASELAKGDNTMRPPAGLAPKRGGIKKRKMSESDKGVDMDIEDLRQYLPGMASLLTAVDEAEKQVPPALPNRAPADMEALNGESLRDIFVSVSDVPETEEAQESLDKFLASFDHVMRLAKRAGVNVEEIEVGSLRPVPPEGEAPVTAEANKEQKLMEQPVQEQPLPKQLSPGKDRPVSGNMPTYPKGLFNNSYLSMAPGTDSDMSSSIKDNKAKLKLPKSGRNVKLETFDNAHQEQKEKEKEKDQSMTSKSSTIDYEPHLKILKLGLNVDLDTIINACRDLSEKQKDQPITSETDNEFVFWLNQREISLNENSSKEMSSNSEVDLESMDLKSLFECESSSSDLPNNLEMKMKPEQEQVKHGPSSSSDLSNNLEMKMKPEQEQVKHGPSAGAAGPEMQAQAPAGRIKLKMD